MSAKSVDEDNGAGTPNNLRRRSVTMPSAPKVFRLPNEILALDLTKEEQMRQSVIYEMIDSEADYVHDLRVTIDVNSILAIILMPVARS
jgi:hypothetical protein